MALTTWLLAALAACVLMLFSKTFLPAKLVVLVAVLLPNLVTTFWAYNSVGVTANISSVASVKRVFIALVLMGYMQRTHYI
jgi:hypothetical protein